MLKVQKKKRSKGLWADAWARMRKNKTAMLSMIIILIIVLMAAFADVITPYDYADQNVREKFLPPSLKHPMGTDNFGRDLFTRVLKGGQISLLVSLCSVALSMAAGILLGATAAYFGGVYGSLVMRLMDILMGIPALLMAVSISAALGDGIVNTIIAISVSTMPSFVRTMHVQVLAEVNKEYMEAATFCGVSSFRKIFRHILPNTLAPILVTATLRISTSIMTISSLSFIGLGVQPPTPEWGSIMATGRSFILDYWPMVTFPGLAIVVVVIAFNFLGDSLRDVLDPRLR